MASLKKVLSCFVFVLTTLSSSHAIDRLRYSELSQKLAALAKQKDWQGAKDVLAEIGRELPAPTPRYFLTMASVEAHLGHKAEALQWLQKFAATGLSYDAARDDDLKAVLANEAGQKISAQMKERSRPLAKAELVCTLSQADIMPEDITYLKASGSKSAPSFIVTSIQHGTLFRVSLPKSGGKECAVDELPLAEEAKRWPTLAVSFDPKRKTLWMTASAMPGFSGFPKEDEGKTLLLEVDANSGKVVHRFDPGTSGPAVLGDMCVTDDGTVYVTDSIGGGVYRLHGDLQTAKLEKIADGLFSPQTPVLARDGKRLFVADYTMGIAVIDLASANASTKVSYLPHPENVAVVAFDGLYLSGDSLIGIQNGTEPVRIMRLRLNQAQTEITGAEVIEQATERMGDPTHAVTVDGWFYVSANVGWSKVDDDTGKLKPGEQFTPPVLLRFPAPSQGVAGK
jgi:sugar lactone lactonase YvrE